MNLSGFSDAAPVLAKELPGRASADQNKVVIGKTLLKRRLATLKETVLPLHENSVPPAKRARSTPEFVPSPPKTKFSKQDLPIHDDQASSTEPTQSVTKFLFVEIFSGAAGLTAAVRSFGIQGIGIDSMVNTSCKYPILRLDLARLAGQEMLWNILKRKNLCGVHMAPPCGAASRAREIKRKRGPSPKPLTSPNLQMVVLG